MRFHTCRGGSLLDKRMSGGGGGGGGGGEKALEPTCCGAGTSSTTKTAEVGAKSGRQFLRVSE